MKKRLLAMLLSLVLVVSLLPVGALAVDGPDIPNGYYTGDLVVRFELHTTQAYKLLMLADPTVDAANTKITDVTLVLKAPGKIGIISQDKERNFDGSVGHETDVMVETISNYYDDQALPSNVESLKISYENKDSETTVTIQPQDLRLVYNENNSAPCYEIESSNDEKLIVAFYYQGTSGYGDAGAFSLYDAAIVDKGGTLSEDQIPVPEYIVAEFGGWSTEKTDGVKFSSNTVVNEDTVLYAQKISGSDISAGAWIHVLNTNNSLKTRFVDVYNASNPNSDISVNDVSWDTLKITVSGNGVSTNKDYGMSDADRNSWRDDYAYYRVNNYDASGVVGPVHNDHIEFSEIEEITLEAKINGETKTVTIPRGDAPGEFSVTVGGSGVGDEVWNININGDPNKPDDTDLLKLLKSAVKVTCTNKAEHTAATYDLLPDSFKVGEVVYTTAGYTCTVTVNAEKYVAEYNNSYEGHSISGENSETITLVYNNGWTVQSTTPVNFNVTCNATAPAPKLSVEKKVELPEGKKTAEVGDVLTYTITIKNTGDVPVTDVTVRDNMWGEGKVEIIHVEDVTYGLSVDGGYWNAVMANGPYGTVEKLNPNETWVCTYSYTVKESDAGETLSNTVTVSGDDEASDTVTVDVPEVPYKILVSFVDENGTPIVPQQTVEVGGRAIPPIEDDGRNIDGWEYNGVAYTGDYNYETLADLVTAKDGWNEVDHAGYLTFNAVYEPEGNEVYNVYFVIPNEEGGSFNPHNEDDDARYTTTATYNAEDDTYEVTFPKVNLNDGYELTGWRIVGKETNHWDAITYEMTGVEHYANDHDLTIEAVVEKTKGNEVYNVYFVIPNEEGGTFNPSNEGDGARYTTTAYYDEVGDTYKVEFPEVVLNDGYELTGWRIVGKETVTWDPVTWEMTAVEHYAIDHNLTIEAIVKAVDAPDMTVDKTVNKPVAEVGDTIKYTITVKNTGNVELTNVAVKDTMFEKADSFIGMPSGAVLTGNTVTIPTLGVGETATITYTYTVRYCDEGKLISNTATVTSEETGTDPEDPIDDTVVVRVDDRDPIIPPIDDDDDEDEFVPKWLNTEDHYAYIVGYEDGTIKPNNDITRAEVATIFFRLLNDDARARFWSTTNDFTDVAEDSWYNNAISTLSNMGIINGYEDGTFKPNAPITRAEFTAIATRFFDYEAEYDGAFNDVSARAWYADYVQAAVDMGLVDGYPDGGFHPDAYITRAEACTIVNRVLHRVPHEDHLLAESVMNTWPDNPKSAWYYEDMQEATNSHDYDWIRDDGETVEDWTKKLPERDWSALETEWATAYSR